MITSRVAAAAALTLTAGLVAFPATAHAVDWQLPPVNVSNQAENSESQQVAAGPDGSTTIVWRALVGGFDVIQTATRAPASTSYSAPVTLSDTGNFANAPVVSIDAAGRTTAAWLWFNGSNWIVQTATREAGSANFAAPQNLSAPGRDADRPRIASGQDGTTTVCWERFDGSKWRVQAATRAPGSNTFGPVQDLSAGGQNAYKPQVAAAPGGRATVTWQRSNGTFEIVQAATRTSGSNAFDPAVDLSDDGQSATSPQIAGGPDGTTTVTWQRYDGSRFRIQARTRPAGSSTFGAVENLSAEGGDASNPAIDTGVDGTTAVTWFRNDGTHNIVQVRLRPAGTNTFNAVENLSAPGQNASYPDVAVGPAGATTVAWDRSNGANTILQAASRAVGSVSFGPAVNLSAAGQSATNAAVVIGLDGANTATWYRSNGTVSVVQAVTSPQSKLVQNPMNKKGKPPKKIKKSGKTVITGKNARTNAGNLISTKVTCKPKKKAGQRTCKVIKGKQGKVTLRTFGVRKVKVTVTQSAPETVTYLPYSKRTVYKNGKRKS